MVFGENWSSGDWGLSLLLLRGKYNIKRTCKCYFLIYFRGACRCLRQPILRSPLRLSAESPTCHIRFPFHFPSTEASSIRYVYAVWRIFVSSLAWFGLAQHGASTNIKYSAYLAQIFIYGWYII